MTSPADTDTAKRDAKDSAPVPSAPKKGKGGLIGTILLIAVLLVGVGVMAYPTVSDLWNSWHATRAIESYEADVANLDPADYGRLREEAEAFNAELASLAAPFYEFPKVESAYLKALNVSDTGIIAVVRIPKIGVALPVYHGTDDAVLNVGVGHLEGSSLPIGGESTHAVLCAHRGLPTAKLFTDLDRLEEGDVFSVAVLDEELTYQVDRILIVEPDHMDELAIVEGEDLVTLQTCTPYGVNSHRLLVRGHRIPTPVGLDAYGDGATLVDPAVVTAVAVLAVAAAVCAAALVVGWRRRAAVRDIDGMLDAACGRNQNRVTRNVVSGTDKEKNE